MNDSSHTVTLSPAGVQLQVARGTRLLDVLFNQSAEFPCGGRGRCKGCRVNVLRGTLPISPEESKLLTREEVNAGRQHCSARRQACVV